MAEDLVASGETLLRTHFAPPAKVATDEEGGSDASSPTSPSADPINFEALKQGAMMLKVPHGRFFGAPRETLVHLSADGLAVEWGSKKKEGAASRITLASLDRVQKGQVNATFRRHAKRIGDAEHCALSFSLIYTASGGEASLDLVALDTATYDLWTNALPRLSRRVKVRRNSVSTDQSIEQMLWDIADDDKSGLVSVKEVLTVVPRLNLKLSRKAIRRIFKEVDADCSGQLDHSEFRDMLRRLRRRPELEELWADIVSGAATPAHVRGAVQQRVLDTDMATVQRCSRSKFVRFLRDVQGHSGEALTNAEVEVNIYFSLILYLLYSISILVCWPF